MDADLFCGWAQTSLTPDQPVLLAGQFHARVSEGVRDPVTATVLALRTAEDHAVLVSLDLVTVAEELRELVRQGVADLPGLDPQKVVLNATHTHTAPETRVAKAGAANVAGGLGVELSVMPVAEYVAFAAERLVTAIREAWGGLAPSALGFGLSQAVIGHNRRWTTFDGVSTMYGNTNDPGFSHLEGYEDHGVGVIALFDAGVKLTGLVVNVACPSQVSEGEYRVSADYWHETRVELRRRFGQDLFVLAQCAAAGDQSPHHLVAKAAEERMYRLLGRNQREELAVRLADAVEHILPALQRSAARRTVLRHQTETVELPRRLLTQADVDEALAEAAVHQAKYEEAVAAVREQPALREQPRWYVTATHHFNRARWYRAVKERHELEQTQPNLPVEVHVLRLGDLAIATSPFEYYLDYGIQIRARSQAVQTMLVQLAGSGTYLPTERAVAGRSYGAVPASTPIGPPGGRRLAERTVALIDALWAD